jgi:putative transcriptional regulator
MPFLHLKKLRPTPRAAKIYLFFALVLLAAPTILYKVLPSQAGKVLVASGVMQGEPFEKAVIFLHTHHGYGAHGYILNKPLSEEDSQNLQRRFPLARQFYYGGPVGVGEVVTLLIPDKNKDGGFALINADILQENDISAYNDIVTDADLMQDVRVFSGYAGWSAFQLNREVMRGGWNVIPYDPAYLEQGARRDIWSKAIDKVLDEKKDSIDAL